MKKFTIILHKIFYDKNGRLILYQKPNASLIASILLFASYYLLNNSFRRVLLIAACGVLVVWAMQEILSGITIFRRILGIITLITLAIFITKHIN